MGPPVGGGVSSISSGVMVLDGVSGTRIWGGGVLALVAFLALGALGALLAALEVFLVTLEAGVTRVAAFLDLVAAAGAIMKCVKYGVCLW